MRATLPRRLACGRRWPTDRMNAAPVRAGVIGAGLMGGVHARAAIRAGAVIEAVADSDSGRARELAASLGRSCEPMTIDDLLRSRRLDAVHVCTPPTEHYALCEAALAAGKHVMCEKPVAQTASEVEALVRLARTSGVQFCPVHQFPFQRGMRDLMTHANRLGPVSHVSAEMCTAGAVGMSPAARHQVALDILPHPLSLFKLFASESIGTVDWKVSCGAHGEIAVIGVTGHTCLSLLLSTTGRPTSNSLRIFGEQGTATVDLFHGYAVVESGHVSRLRKMSRPFVASGLTLGHAAANGLRRGLSGETEFPGLRELVSRFYSAVRGDLPAPIPPEAVVDVAIARDRIISLISVPA